MADSNPDTSKVGKTFKALFKDAAISLVIDVLFAQILSGGIKKIPPLLDKRLFQDQRAELLEDFRKMGSADRKNTKRLVRRHKKSIKEFKEDRFVTLLCKIPVDPVEGRRPTLQYLNDLKSDREFDQMLCILDHDPIAQFLQRMATMGEKLTGENLAKLKGLLDDAGKEISSLDRATASKLRGFADWLESTEKEKE